MTTLRPRRWLKRVVLYAAIGIGVWWAVCGLIAYGFVHPSRFAVRQMPSDAGMRFESVSFPSRTDGLTLRGWWVPAPRPRGVLALFHGYPGNRGDLVSHADFLHRAGYSLLLFDFRALGESDGALSTIGYREVDDAEAALDYLQSRPDTKGLTLGILGTSMGAAVALQTAAKRPEVRAVVADSSYASLDRAIDQRFRAFMGNAGPFLSVPVQWYGEELIGAASSSVSPLEAVTKLADRPVFFIHGASDITILPEDSRILYARKPGIKTLWVIEGARHIRGHTIARREYEQRVLSFLRTSLNPP